MSRSILKLLLLCVFLPTAAPAHTGVGEATGFIHGFGHPLGGADHLLAMVAVGLWAAQIGGRALWAVPLTFVGVMIAGGFLGFNGIPVPFIEGGILLSILLLGVLIAGAFRFPLVYSVLVVGVFAVFHGHAHGAEMPVAAGAVAYTLGFALATAMLHLAGMALGALMQQINLQTVHRFAGGAIALAGIYLVFT